jgi:hypothetical protein
VRQVLGADARSRIRDFEGNAVVLYLEEERDTPVFGRELQRVAEKVAEDLHQAIAIASYDDTVAVGRGLELDVLACGERAKRVGDFLDDRSDVLVLGHDFELTVLGARCVDEVADQLVGTIDGAIDDFEPLEHLLGLRRFSSDEGGARLDRGKGRSKVVRHDREHLFSRNTGRIGARACLMQRLDEPGHRDGHDEEKKKLERGVKEDVPRFRPEVIDRERAQDGRHDARPETSEPCREHRRGKEDEVPILVLAPPRIERQATGDDRASESDDGCVPPPSGPSSQGHRALHDHTP